MERSDRVAVVPCDPALVGCRLLARDVGADGQGRERQRAPGRRCRRAPATISSTPSNRLVALAGVQGLAVIETADAVLVADRKNSDAVTAGGERAC